MRYARIHNNVVAEIIESNNIDEQFHPAIAATMVECDDTVTCGMILTESGFEQPVIAEKTAEEKAGEQYFAIDAHITANIKTLDYDNTGQVSLCCIGGEYQIEALRVQEWIDKCWKIQADIKSGVVVFDSVEQAIAALPAFEILV